MLRSSTQTEPSTSGPPSSEPPPGVSHAIHHEQLEVDRLASVVEGGGVGFVEGRKPPDVVRIMGNNVNSLCLFDDERSWKVPKINELNRRYQVDGMLLQECGTDFRQVPDTKAFASLFGDHDCRSVAANNVTEPSG